MWRPASLRTSCPTRGRSNRLLYSCQLSDAVRRKRRPSFASWNALWAFSQAVRSRSRFLPDRRVSAFLRAVTASATSRCTSVHADRVIWRAQIGHDYETGMAMGGEEYDEPSPFKPDRMK